ncbi:hypothetical protein ACH4FV_00730 [Streptomyces anulatus]|uniref:hypothetical protein n=1 Tax=Streptomyces anulatus TaxID=1892 RepID=UPI002E13B9AE|nr:hypothetical protein OG557_24595 [Streptomyces anulatus]
MADEHYEWLDKDAAERLLRGEPVVPVGDEARTDAFRLAEALGAARGGPRPRTGELPGEDAVLAAFRQAGHGNGVDRLAGRAAGAAVPGRPGLLHAVHIGSAPDTPVRRPRWSRPVRFGLVASLAGCALGGVAVAAGTGVFTGTFGGQGSPAPATSVSAAVTPGPLISGESTDDPSSPADPPPPDEPADPSSPATRESEGPEKPDGERTGDTGRESGEDRPGNPDRPGGDGREETPGGGDDQDEQPGGSGDDTPSGNWYEQSVKACKAFRDGTLDDRSRRELIRFAKGEKNLERFCDRLLDGSDGSGGSGGSDGGGDDDDDGGQSGPGDGGSLPPVSFHPVPRSGVAPEPEAGADTEVAPLPRSTGTASVLTR